MANYDTNVFEKYGIKEVADVTFYRIDKKKEKYEAQRKITPASILQGEIEKTTVYPLELQDDGSYAGGEEGYEAYIFPDAEIIKGINYECDDGFYYEKDITSVPVTITYKKRAATAADLKLSANKLSANKIRLGADNAQAGGQYTDIVSISKNELLKAVSDAKGSTLIKTLTAVKKDAKEGDASAVADITIKVNSSNITGRTYIRSKNALTSFSAEALNPTDGSVSVLEDPEKKLSTREIIKAKHSDYIPEFDYTTPISKIRYITDTNGTATTDIEIPAAAEDGSTGLLSLVLKFAAKDDSIAKTEVKLTSDDVSTRADGAGTHEYTYAEQITMLFAKNQNLIDRRGVRYVFEKANEMFGDIDFDDKTAAVAPGSTERVVVVGVAGSTDETNYDLDEVKEEIKTLTDEYSAKAYDVEYSDYCELLVEDEMGFFDPAFLGDSVSRVGTGKRVNFFGTSDYDVFATNNKGIDFAISETTTWADGEHESINDAIDALRAKKLVIDTGAEDGLAGIDKIHGGYLVTGSKTDKKPEHGKSDVAFASNVRETDFDEDYRMNIDGDVEYDKNYTYNVAQSKTTNYTLNGTYRSNYALEKVLEALSKLVIKENIQTLVNDNNEVEVKISAENGKPSNRAIYVNVDGATVTATGSFIYLLHNINYKKLKSDRDGVFKFSDKKGNTLYYQDHIFAGTEYLALVIIGTKGLIFTVGRHGKKKFTDIAWMVSNNGFVTNKQAGTLVKAGLIHTIPHTELDETFDATCTVEDMKIRKIEKESKHYTPVLFLDTLKTSTIEQAAETTYATGGNGNANLIGWDYSKEITLTLEDALYSPASMNMMWGKADEDGGIVSGVKDVHKLDRFEKIKAKRNFIIPAGNQDGTPSEADSSVQTVYYNPATMEPFQDGTPIAEGEVIYKWTRTVAYDDNSLGRQIEISADGFPGTYRIVGETYARMQEGGKDQRFQFEICEAKIGADGMAITLEADGDPAVNANCHNANAAVKCA